MDLPKIIKPKILTFNGKKVNYLKYIVVTLLLLSLFYLLYIIFSSTHEIDSFHSSLNNISKDIPKEILEILKTIR